MARTPPPKPKRPDHTPEQKLLVVERLKKRITELEDFDPKTVKSRFETPEVDALEAAIDEALSFAFGHGTVEYQRYGRAKKLDHGPITMTGGWGRTGFEGHNNAASEAQKYLTEGKEQALSLLRQAVRGLEEEIAEQEHLSQFRLSSPSKDLPKNKVFVVHGHDDAALQAVARFLEKLGLCAIVLREQPDQGRATIEKFEDYASEVGFAVVLLTPDDLAEAPNGAHKLRARQNVLFELGYFAGKLGRGRTCLLMKGDVEIPSDLYGVINSDLDADEGWKLKLVRELKAAKLEFDADRAF